MTGDLPGFEKLMALAKTDPEKFERLRHRYTRELIRKVPAHLQPRLRGLQFEIDNRRRLAKNPLAACICISKMMHAAFQQLNNELNHAPSQRPIQKEPNVIPFRKH